MTTRLAVLRFFSPNMRTPDFARTLLRNALVVSSLLGIAQSPVEAQRAAIPTPESILGFAVGADFKLATYDESMKYFSALAASSNRVKLIDVGKTATGHPWTLVLISSPENLAKIDRLKEIARRLAHPENLTDDQARALSREGKAFVDISGGLHASEIAGSQHTIQLAYNIVAHPDSAPIKAILDNTVLLLWPSINPDGQNIVVNWYREVVGTPYEVSPLHE
ncbi:MAG: M14 family zinc carboxypeptidase, partial [Gemmatimonadaceae bacterium]